MERDSQSRKWQITINNPVEKGFTHEKIKEQLAKFKSISYWCMADEIGENGTYHTHIYMALDSASRFSTMKQRFEGAHFEIANGTSQQNRDYVFKDGKWLVEKKHETNIADTQEEYGTIPVERQGARNDLADLYDMIKQGMTDYDILEQCPHYIFNMEKIERARQIVRQNAFKDTFRTLFTTYIFGETGTGKTRGIMERHGYTNAYRVTDYEHPYDGYKGQPVIVFEEFRSSLRIQDMLNYLDGYPLELPCRYANKIACYETVYIVSNIELEQQYITVQEYHKGTYEAFLRRINRVVEHTTFGVEQYESATAYLNRFKVIQEDLGVFKKTGT